MSIVYQSVRVVNANLMVLNSAGFAVDPSNLEIPVIGCQVLADGAHNPPLPNEILGSAMLSTDGQGILATLTLTATGAGLFPDAIGAIMGWVPSQVFPGKRVASPYRLIRIVLRQTPPKMDTTIAALVDPS